MNKLAGPFIVVLLVALALVSALAGTWWSDSPSSAAAGGPPAAARVISDTADLIGGTVSRGRLGDYYLANSEVQVVIQAPQRNLLSVGQFGGQIIDADLVRAPSDPERDSFEEWAFGINLENTCHYTSVTVVNDGSNGQPAVIRATGVDDLLDFINPSSQVAGFGFPIPAAYDDADLPVTCSTDYSLAPGDTFVEVETTITNTSGSAVETFFTDFLSASGDVESFMPGYGFGEPLVTTACARCNFVSWGGVDDAAGVAYGYIHNVPASTLFNTGGVNIPVLGVDAALALVGFAAPNYTIPPSGGSETVTRYFAIADDIGSVIDTRNQLLGYTTGTLSGTVTRGGSPVEDAEVTVLGAVVDGPGSAKNVVAYYRTGASGDYSGTLPPGNYTLQAHLNGHMPASPDPAAVTITASSTTDQDFTIPEAGRLQVTIVDESGTDTIAGKVSVLGFDQYPDPGNSQTILGIIHVNTKLFNSPLGDFRDGMRYGLATVLFAADSGDTGEVFLEPGDYHVVVSHGTEYSIFEQDVTLTAGNLTTVNAQIAPVIDSSGFISGDFHIHQIHSPDSTTTLEERVISILAEGVDFFTPADHEHRTDIGPVISSLGADGLTSAAPSNETTTPDYGHFIGWPLTIDPAKVNGGALDFGSEGVPPVPPPAGQDFPSFGNYMMPPSEIFDNLLADPGVDTVQINHIDTFFDLDGLAVDTAYIPPQDFADNAKKRLDPAIPNLFDDSFTALESWQGAGRSETLDRFVGRSMGDWFNMLDQGILRSSVADSDTHHRVLEAAGFPRTMVASPTDAPGGLDDVADTLAGNVNAGRATGTNGPFIRVTSEASSTGDQGGLELGKPTLIETTDGAATITVDIQSPIWAEFDTVEFYVNNVPTLDDFDNNPLTPPAYRVAPDYVKTAGTDFTITTVDDFPSISGAEHLEATVTLGLTGLTQDTWVVVLVRGTDGVSKPIFPIVPNDLDTAANPTLADLTDGNLGEDGITTMAFSNPLYIDIGGNGAYNSSDFDTDRDGCTNQQEMGPSQIAGGRRSPSNPFDYFNPSHDGKNRIDDVLLAVQAYYKDDNDGSPGQEPYVAGYNPDTDRRLLGPNEWNLGAPNGLQRIDDVLNAVHQYYHDCV
jgi:hypothetical protein